MTPIDVYAQVMIGNGDGTFTPSFDFFQFGVLIPPELAALNLLGDGKIALVTSAGFTSSFQIFPSVAAPFLQSQMVETPIVSGDDALRSITERDLYVGYNRFSRSQ